MSETEVSETEMSETEMSEAEVSETEMSEMESDCYFEEEDYSLMEFEETLMAKKTQTQLHQKHGFQICSELKTLLGSLLLNEVNKKSSYFEPTCLPQLYNSIHRCLLPPYLLTSLTCNKIPISKIDELSKVHIIGKVMRTSGLKSWRNHYSSGVRINFNVRDESGEILVVGWTDDGVAEAASRLIHEGMVIELVNASVSRRIPQYNNTNHKFQLKLYKFSAITALPIDMNVQKMPNYLTYEEIRKCEKNTYFDVAGKIIELHEPIYGTGVERGNDFKGQSVTILDEKNGQTIEIMFWDDYDKLIKKDVIGKHISVIGAKYSSKWESVNSTDTKVTIE